MSMEQGLCNLMRRQDTDNIISPSWGCTGGEAKQIACEDLV